MAVAVGLLALLIGLAWPSLLELPSPGGTRAVVSGTGILGALVTVLVPERFTPLSGVVMVCAIGVFASFAHQMLRSERRELTESLTGTIAGVFVSGIAACWLLAHTAALHRASGTLDTATATGGAVRWRALGEHPAGGSPRDDHADADP